MGLTVLSAASAPRSRSPVPSATPGPHHREPRLQHLQGRQRYQRYQDHDHRTEGRLGPRRQHGKLATGRTVALAGTAITVIDTSIVMVPNCTAATATFALL